MSSMTEGARAARRRTPLNRSQIAGFWGAWAGWTLDGMDSFIYALVLTPALTELLPRSGFAASSANIGLAGSILFALFLVGWGLSFIWGPLADRFDGPGEADDARGTFPVRDAGKLDGELHGSDHAESRRAPTFCQR